MSGERVEFEMKVELKSKFEDEVGDEVEEKDVTCA